MSNSSKDGQDRAEKAVAENAASDESYDEPKQTSPARNVDQSDNQSSLEKEADQSEPQTIMIDTTGGAKGAVSSSSMPMMSER